MCHIALFKLPKEKWFNINYKKWNAPYNVWNMLVHMFRLKKPVFGASWKSTWFLTNDFSTNVWRLQAVVWSLLREYILLVSDLWLLLFLFGFKKEKKTDITQQAEQLSLYEQKKSLLLYVVTTVQAGMLTNASLS